MPTFYRLELSSLFSVASSGAESSLLVVVKGIKPNGPDLDVSSLISAPLSGARGPTTGGD